MSLTRQRVSSPRLPTAAVPGARATLVGCAALAATLVVLLASATPGSALPVLLAVAAVGLLAVVRQQAGHRVVRPLPVPTHPSGVAHAVRASTAYWCAIPAPGCPRRPRAPGRS